MTPTPIGSLFPTPDQVPPAFRLGGPIDQREYLLAGRLERWEGPMRPVVSPICLRRGEELAPEPMGQYPRMTEEAALAALEAAAEAYDNGRGRWPTMPVADRIRHVQQFLFGMKARREEVVRLLMWEIGKSLADSQKEFDRTVAYVQDTIDALKDLDRVSSRFAVQEGILAQIRRAPLGVVLCMGPFNYPLNETFTTLIPALIMGNPVVFKPPKLGVLLHRPLLEAFREAFPPGVVNTVYGDGSSIIGPMMASGKVNVLAFIGSSRVADILKHQHPRPHRLRCVLGLDAKNAAIILPDADLDLTVKECLAGTLGFNGQRCTALKMLFVHSRVAGDFLDRFSRAVDALKVGMPWDDGVAVTPLADESRVQYMSDVVADALAGGARLANAGGQAEKTLFRPAVVTGLTERMRLWREEQFGPVVPVQPFDDLAEPTRYVVESPFGQQVSVFGQDPQAIGRLIDPLVNQVCRVNLNSQCQRGPDVFPFTGRKDSAEGTLSVSDALRVFTIRTLVAAKATDANKALIDDIVRNRRSEFLSTDFIL